MADSNKPLFSRPVLAAVMLFSTLAIWLLNLTAPTSSLPTPKVERWTTDSGVPVVWLNQDAWQNSDKLELRFTFRAPSQPSALVDTTLAMLMSDALPLSTSSINQRFAPLAAKAHSHYDHETQTIGLTLSNEMAYLEPTLALATTWLNNPDFKPRTFDNWQRQQNSLVSMQQNLEQLLFFDEAPDPSNAPLSLEQINRYYQTLKHSASAIYVVGHLSDEAKSALDDTLNKLTRDYRLATTDAGNTIEHVSAVIRKGTGTLYQTHSALAFTPITSIQDWISLQIWGVDLMSALNKSPSVEFVQLALTLSPKRPWAQLHIQHKQAFTDPLPPEENGEINAKVMPFIEAKQFVFAHQVPSANDDTLFQTHFSTFKDHLEQQILSPSWWATLATQVTHEDGLLPLQQFTQDYKNAIESFTIEDYRTALQQRLLSSSYQEIQIYQ
ncbi:insulinase family protein [Marinomonas sp. A79]|uniref:Insulinase family protein n=1 Tax=Marinomonas vulgaris TaxID=2823372 RepID=A0ABS5HDB0_9GAMM|nr:insulinase family protein [Marinomonas vulgaris]MBR7889628.1 insulinase family protein [Marinomonas vulgaris]